MKLKVGDKFRGKDGSIIVITYTDDSNSVFDRHFLNDNPTFQDNVPLLENKYDTKKLKERLKDLGWMPIINIEGFEV